MIKLNRQAFQFQVKKKIPNDLFAPKPVVNIGKDEPQSVKADLKPKDDKPIRNDFNDNKNNKDIKDSKDNKEIRDSKDIKDDFKSTKDSKTNKDNDQIGSQKKTIFDPNENSISQLLR